MKKLQKGFTLIELMIVIAIIGILAAFALPAYSNYIARTEAAEAFTIIDGLKTDVTIEYGQSGCLAGGTQYSGKYVNDITLLGSVSSPGTVSATVGSNAAASASSCAYIATYKDAKSASISSKISTAQVAFGYWSATTAGTEHWACLLQSFDKVNTTLLDEYNSKQCLAK